MPFPAAPKSDFSQPKASPAFSERPTSTRQLVIVFAVTLAILSYIDRVCISQAQGDIARDFGLSKSQMGWVFSAFAIAYALFEVPGGWLGDKLGPRKVLMRIVIWWSVFTAATGYMWSWYSLMACRFLFGAGEAGCFPNLTKSFSSWLPRDEQVRAQGIMWMAARWGGAVTPLLVYKVLQYMTWRTAFILFAALGVVWAIGFYRWYRDNPKDHPKVNEAELALIQASAYAVDGHADVPWSKLIFNRSIALLWVQYFLITYPWYFYITWLPTYIKESREITGPLQPILAGLPLLLGGFGSLTCGFLAPRLERMLGGLARSRRLIACTGFLTAAIMLFVSIQIKEPVTALIVLGLAGFCNDLIMPCAWGACMNIGGKYAGTLSGSMNMMGNIAGFVAPMVGGAMIEKSGGDYTGFLYTMVLAYVLGALVWPFIDPVTPMEEA